MEIRFDGKVSLVIGGSRGLGKSIAQTLAASGSDIVIADVLDEAGVQTCQEIRTLGKDAAYVHTDVTDMAQVQALFAGISQLDIVVHCVGITMTDTLTEASQEKVKRLFDINILGSNNVTQEAMRKMLPQNSGKILLLSSVAGKIADETVPHYRMSKAAVLSLTMSAAMAGAKHNINVNALCPGIIRTDMWEKQLLPGKAEQMNMSKEKAWNTMVSKLVPMGRAQSPQDIANAAAFLCSDLAENITGQALCIDGGQCMRL